MLGVFKKKSDLPEYLSHYGMHRAPFSSSIEDDMYYADPVRQQRLDVLLHLTQNSNELLVLIGEQGIGKTTFINQFLKNTPEHWKVCFIEGHKMMTEEQFLERVFLGFNIAHASVHKGTMLSNLRKRLESMLEDAIPVLLVIDDAQLFSTKVLALLLEIASIKNTRTGGSVRVLLASEPQIKIILAEPVLDDAHDLIVRKIDLPPLDETSTGNYLHHRLTQAGMVVEQFLTKPTISKIYRNSGGIPSKINEAADKLLFDTTPIIRRNSNIQLEQQFSLLKRVVISLLIAAIIGVVAYFYYERSENSHSEKIERKSETRTTLKLPPIETLTESPATFAPEKTGKEASDPMESLKEELAGKSDSEKTAAPSTSLPPLIQTEEVTHTPAVQPPATDLAQPTANKLPQKPELKDNTWVLAQNPEHYTLQLVAGRQKQTIANFINKYKLSENLIYFSSKRNGKIWHNLSYGIYPNRKSVNQAIKKLPVSLANEKPWIRQLSAIQSEIRKMDQP